MNVAVVPALSSAKVPATAAPVTSVTTAIGAGAKTVTGSENVATTIVLTGTAAAPSAGLRATLGAVVSGVVPVVNVLVKSPANPPWLSGLPAWSVTAVRTRTS